MEIIMNISRGIGTGPMAVTVDGVKDIGKIHVVVGFGYRAIGVNSLF